MAMQVLFAPGYIAPSRIRLEEQMLRQQAVETGLQNVAQAFQSYVDTKAKQKLEKMGTMAGLAATYGGQALGQPFQDEYGQLMHSYGIDFPQSADGHYTIPESFEGKLRGYITQHPEMIPTLLGTQRPELSAGELRLKGEEQDIKLNAIQQRAEAADLKHQADLLKLEENLTAIREQIAGRQKVAETNVEGGITRTQIQAGASVTRAQIAADAKEHGDTLADATKRLGIDAKVAVGVYGIDAKQASAVYGYDVRKAIADEQTGVKREQLQSNERVAALRYANQPQAQPSGMYNFNGQLVDAGTLNSNPSKYAGAIPLNNGQASLMLRYSSLRDLDQDRMQKYQLLRNKLEQDMGNKQISGLIQTVGLAIRNKDPRISTFAWGKLLHELNDKDHLGLTEDDLRVMTEHKGILESIKDFFGEHAPDGGNVDSAPEVPAQGVPSTTSTTTPSTTTTTQSPQKAPTNQAPGTGTLSNGTPYEVIPVQ